MPELGHGSSSQQGVAGVASQSRGALGPHRAPWAGCVQGPAAARCQHRWDSCNEWAGEPPQRHTVPSLTHMASLWTAEQQQQQ